MLDAVDREREGSLIKQVDRRQIDAHLDALEGLNRISGSEDEREASEYVVETLESYGVDARINEYEGVVSIPETATLHVTQPDERTVKPTTTVSFSESADIEGPLIRFDPDSEPDGDHFDLSGNVALVSGLPSADATAAAERAGAKGVVFQSPREHLYQGIVSPVWGTPDESSADDLPSIPVVEVTQQEGRRLAHRLEREPVHVTVSTSVRTEPRTLPNPVGYLQGSESSRYLVIGNHIDSWFEGMTDNATAVAATLEIARIFSRQEPKRGILFGFWSAHSTGRYAGSTSFVDENWCDLRRNGVAYLHLDLLGLDGADSLWYQHMAEVEAEHLDAMQTATELDLRAPEESRFGGSRPARNSDQSFWGVGLSSLLSGARFTPGTDRGGPVGGGWWWHTRHDTRDKVDLDVLGEETKLYVALAARICESPILPHDYRQTIDEIEATLDDIETTSEVECRFDDLRDEIATLRTTLNKVYELPDEPRTDDHFQAFEDLQVRLGNLLIPALYVRGPDTRQEPAIAHDLLPYLRTGVETDGGALERVAAETSLRRGRSRLRNRLRKADDFANSFLQDIDL